MYYTRSRSRERMREFCVARVKHDTFAVVRAKMLRRSVVSLAAILAAREPRAGVVHNINSHKVCLRAMYERHAGVVSSHRQHLIRNDTHEHTFNNATAPSSRDEPGLARLRQAQERERHIRFVPRKRYCVTCVCCVALRDRGNVRVTLIICGLLSFARHGVRICCVMDLWTQG